jgi:glycosyltransferase involved in cell wall biosynthesis
MARIKKIGIFADFPKASTGMAVVCHNIARNLCKLPLTRVIYFGRWGLPQNAGLASPMKAELIDGYEYVPSEGGVWRKSTVVEAIKKYKLDIVFSEDDWFSADGLVEATEECKVPFHFLTPIDSLPIHKDAFKVFKGCKKIYTPNHSYKLINNGIYLPHGVDSKVFTPLKTNQRRIFSEDKFSFLWIGRDEPRKALGRAIIAFKNIHEKVPNAQMVIRTDWKTEKARKTLMYLSNHSEIPVIRDGMKDVPHSFMQKVFANCEVLVITSKAGGFEMQSIEAMACGLPVLCTDWTFMNEAIVDNKNGFRIPVSSMCGDSPEYGRIWGNISIDRLSEKMLWCAQNPAKVKSMGMWARQFVYDNYSWKEIARKVYEEIMGKKK